MRKHALVATAMTLAMGLAPLSAFAAETKTESLTEDELLEVLESEAANGVMMDRGGGGGGLYYPGPYGNGITVDASVTEEVTPDFIAVNGYCEVTGLASRDEVRTELTRVYNAIKAAVGTDGRVRRSGPPSVYPFYDASGNADTAKMSGSLNVFIRVLRNNAAQRIADILDAHACSPGWDVRLINPEDHEAAQLDALVTRVNKRKAIFEKLLGKKLSNVIGASLSTWVDGWSSYDPETNKADATTTLSITFEVGSDATISTPTTRSSTRSR